jgi:hypothetical protein
MSHARRARARISFALAVTATSALTAAVLTTAACTDLASYSTSSGKQYVGCVVAADFVLTGVSPTTELCLTLDANQLQTAPGALSSTDGRFQSTPLRPIPQLWNDPLSTFNFGEGRTKNLLYMASPSPDAGGGGVGGDVTVVVSLMESGDVEVRLLRGAPGVTTPDAASTQAESATNIFAVFPLKLRRNGCASLSASSCAPDAAPL